MFFLRIDCTQNWFRFILIGDTDSIWFNRSIQFSANTYSLFIQSHSHTFVPPFRSFHVFILQFNSIWFNPTIRNVCWQVALRAPRSCNHSHSHPFAKNKVIEMTQITSITKQLNLESIKSNKLDDYIWVGQIICRNNGLVLDSCKSFLCALLSGLVWCGCMRMYIIIMCLYICFTLERWPNHTFIEINTNWAKM